jgi:hypothetical protein
MISIYGDESSDSNAQRVYAVAALQGPEDVWDELRTLWRERLEGKVFHSADCDSGYGNFRGMLPEVRGKLHIDLTSILANSGLIGWGLAIDLKGCTLAFPEVLADHTANSCFFRTMLFHVDKVHADHPSQPLRIVFDRNKKTEHNSRLLFEYLSEESEPGNTQWLPREPEFVSREEIGVQAADLWVRELMKFLDGTIFSGDNYKPRAQWEILLKTKRFGADLQFGAYFQSMKDQMPTLESKTGMNREKYISWLRQKKRQDNQSNRIEYMRDVAANDRRAAENNVDRTGSSDARKRRHLDTKDFWEVTGNNRGIDRNRSRIIFDTSGLNKLKDEPDQQGVLHKLRDAYEVLISETSVVELSATKDAETRTQLVDVCERLLSFGHCLMPHNWIAEEMPRLNARYRDRFRWDDVDINAPMIRDEILQREFLSQDRMAEESRQFAKENNKRFVDIFEEARDKFGADFPDTIKDVSLAEFIAQDKAVGGPFWKTVAGWYRRARLITLDEGAAREFIDRCPPFHALAMGAVIAHYQYAIPRGSEKAEFAAGRNDLFMAVYLPYCDVFVTDDVGQQNALRAIAQEVGLGVKVLSYPDFRAALLCRRVESATA